MILNVCQLLNVAEELYKDRLAIEQDDLSLSYEQLRTITNNKAQLLLKSYHLQTGDVVGIYAECKMTAIIWIIAILKAGGTFVALDNKWPKSRIKSAIELANIKIFVTDLNNVEEFKDTGISSYIPYAETYPHGDSFSLPTIESDNLAYIVFTSGSTGTPKGVKMSHGSLVNYLDWECSHNGTTLNHKVLQFFPLSFDISFQEYFSTLVLGGSLIIANEHIKTDMHSFLEFINNEHINKLYLPYVLLVELAEYCTQNNTYPITVKRIISSGEKLIVTNRIKELFFNIPYCRLINLYGASEIQVISVCEMSEDPHSWPVSAPIGWPIKNVTIFILDEDGVLIHNDAIGEMYIMSVCLTSGYISNDISANNKFVSKEINGKIARLYRTGDMVKRATNGSIEYIGRNDFQIKIRGNRVELGEIDQVLAACPLVKQSITISKDFNNNNRLISYIVIGLVADETTKNAAMIFDPADKLEFKLQQNNIRQVPEANSIMLPVMVLSAELKNSYFSRKSYRDFLNVDLQNRTFDSFLKHIVSRSREDVKESTFMEDFSVDSINQCLHLFASVQSENQILPKYRYPSAGSLYPVQVYIEVGRNVRGVAPGYYYYNPQRHSLHLLHRNTKDEQVQFRIYFVGNIPSIAPLYADLSKQFCFIELGYMYDLLSNQLRNEKMQLSPDRQFCHKELTKILKLNSEDIILAGYSLANNYANTNIEQQPEIYVYIKGKIHQYNVGWYKFDTTKEQLVFINYKPFTIEKSLDKNYSIYKQSSFAIFFTSAQKFDGSSESLHIHTGRISNILMRHATQHDIGLCPIGTLDTSGHRCLREITNGIFIQAMFGGRISNEQIMYTGQSEAKDIKKLTSEEVKNYLLTKLPDYMQPEQIIVLDSLPITVNGKVDRKALPEPYETEITAEYITPQGIMEYSLAEIWCTLLNKELISREDNFFSLGGNSLIATRFISKMRTNHKTELPLKLIFQYPILKNLSAVLEKEFLAQDLLPPIKVAIKNKPLPLSFAQQRLWFLEQLLPGLSVYHEPICLNLKGNLNVDILKQSLDFLVKRHEVLRTKLTSQNGIAQQQILEPATPFNLRICKLDKTKDNDIDFLINAEIKTPFNFENETLCRGLLLESDPDQFYLILTFHHVIADYWSINLFCQELHHCYTDLLSGTTSTLAPLTVQYADFTVWQRSWLDGELLERQLSYWKQHLYDLPHFIIPTDRTRPKDQNYVGNYYECFLKTDTLHKLIQTSSQESVTLFMTLLAAFMAVIGRYANQEDVVIGTPIANRRASELENLIGFFANTLVLRANIANNPSFKDLLQIAEQITLDAYENQDAPFEQIVNALNVKRDLNLHPLFQIMFILQNTASEQIQLGNLNVHPMPRTEHVAQFDLVFVLTETNMGLKIGIEFAQDLYDLSTIQKITQAYTNFLEIAATDVNIRLSEISILNTQDVKQISYWNNTKKDYSDLDCVHKIFEQMVNNYPDQIAVTYENSQLTYTELNHKSNILANLLRKHGVRTDALVGISSAKGLELIIAILAVLKSGGAYVPLDPEYPQDRLNYMLDESHVQILLTHSTLEAKYDSFNGMIILLDEAVPDQDITNLDIDTHPEALAYVIYTSGSTGRPKGVAGNHRALANHMLWMLDTYFTNIARPVVLQKASYNFDASLWEIFIPLMSGGNLVLISQDDAMNINSLESIIIAQQVNAIEFTPTVLNILLDGNFFAKCKSLKIVFSSSEALNAATLERYKLTASTADIVNLYGPTEAAIDCTSFNCLYPHCFVDSVPIGYPIANTQIYILDTNLNQVPIGTIGEIYVAGLGLARGYLNNPTTTADRFIPNPYANGERMYKTGDIGKYYTDGAIEFLGRSDHQISIRGFRIEIGEIESTIQELASVSQCVVLVREDDPALKRLVAYVVPVNNDYADSTAFIEAIVNKCKDKLPDYMQPSHIMLIENMPFTPNGKIDKNALPKPQDREGLDIYHAPEGTLEIKLAKIWSELLRIEKIGRDDDFFRLGGHSLLATQLISKLRNTENIDIPLKVIFQQRTISALAIHVQQANLLQPITLVARDEFQPLSFAQQRLWFIEQYQSGSNAYNTPFVFKLSPACNLLSLQNSIKSIIARHEILRTLIKIDDLGQPYQKVTDLDNTSLNIKFNSVSTVTSLEDHLENDINHIFNLSAELPIYVNLYELNTQSNISHYLNIVIHHIAFDGWSSDIFLKELHTYYGVQQTSIGHDKLDLPDLAIQYSDFSAWQRKFLTGEVLDKQVQYWKEKLNDYSTLSIITDKVRPPQVDYAGSNEYFEISAHYSNLLRRVAKELGVSLYTVLLAGFYLMLRAYSNQTDIVVGTPVANRHYPHIENLIGFFVNTVVLRQIICNSINLVEFIQQVGETVIEAQVHQDLPFEKLIEILQVTQDQSRHPIFQVMFMLDDINHNTNTSALKHTDKLLENYQSIRELDNIAKFDLSGIIDVAKEQIYGNFNYSTSIFASTTICGFISTYVNILQQFAELLNSKSLQNSTKVQDISFLNATQYQLMTHDWNSTGQDYPRHKTLQQLFEEQVARTPNKTALVYEDTALTYLQLNERSNRIAHYLINLNKIQPDDLVAICIDRNEYMLLAILGTLKSGGAYVPIDPQYPNDRIGYMLDDANIRIILTNEIYQQRLENIAASSHTTILSIDNEEFKQNILLEPKHNPKTKTNSRNSAYVIYTSGTTGRPKGVIIEHAAIINRINWMNRAYPLGTDDVILHKTAYTFDVSVWELLWAHWYGATIVFAENEQHRDMLYLLDLIRKQNVTVVHFVPSALEGFISMLAAEANPEVPALPLKRIFCSGEELKLEQVQRLHIILPHTEIHNLYGPTEAAIDVLYFDCNDRSIEKVFIGKPIDNIKVYVLNNEMQAVPVGSIGELYLGGVGLARGYINKPELTAERFVPDPFLKVIDSQNEINSTKLYKTGDLVRYSSSGNIEFLGRVDHQIKLRGFRIELGEIESVVLTVPGVLQVVALCREDLPNQQRLVVYIVAQTFAHALNSPNASTHKGELIKHIRAACQTNLPEYMQPNFILMLDKLPLSINDKIDRKALPQPDEHEDINTFQAPVGVLEQSLYRIWAKLLGTDKIGRNDNFFRLGGHSLLTPQLIRAIINKLKVNIAIRDVFNYPTINKLALFISNHDEYRDKEDQTIPIFQESQIDFEIPDIEVLQKYFAEPQQILLTGSTGFVGAYILSDLLIKTKAEIFCLVNDNNHVSAMNKIINNLKFYHLYNEAYMPRLHIVLGNLAQNSLGLRISVYQHLSENIDYIYHVAAHMNNHADYVSLKAINVDATKEIIKLSINKKLKKVIYVSTTSIFSSSINMDISKDEDYSTINEIHRYSDGYSGTKCVADQIMQNMIINSLPIYIFRLGLIVGAKNVGKMPNNQWFPKLLQSCLIMNSYYDELNVAATPVDFAAHAITTLSLDNNIVQKHIYHICNPNMISIEDFLISETTRSLHKVPMSEWLGKCRTYIEQGNELPIASFLEDLASLIEHQSNVDCNKTLDLLRNSGIAFPNMNKASCRLYTNGIWDIIKQPLY